MDTFGTAPDPWHPYQPPKVSPGWNDPPADTRQGHSGFGIASFALALLVAVAEILTIGAATMMVMNAPGQQINEQSSEAIFLGLLMIGTQFLALIGLALGIVGMVQRDRKRVFGLIGVMLNGLLMIGFIGLMLLGMSVA